MGSTYGDIDVTQRCYRTNGHITSKPLVGVEGALTMEPATINWHTFFFLLFSVVAIVFALAVLFASNVVRVLQDQPLRASVSKLATPT